MSDVTLTEGDQARLRGYVQTEIEAAARVGDLTGRPYYLAAAWLAAEAVTNFFELWAAEP